MSVSKKRDAKAELKAQASPSTLQAPVLTAKTSGVKSIVQIPLQQ